MVQLAKTKEIIFDIAVGLFSDAGFEEANMREIAKRSGITSASIYNYFSGKQEILDCIYSYYVQHFNDNVKTWEEFLDILRNGSNTDLIKAILFTFEDEDEKKYRRMVLISKIIYMRIFNDEQARDIFLRVMITHKEDLTKKLLDYGIECGKFKPFDTETYSVILNECRHIMGIKAFARPGYEVQQLDEETKLIGFFSAMLPRAEQV